MLSVTRLISVAYLPPFIRDIAAEERRRRIHVTYGDVKDLGIVLGVGTVTGACTVWRWALAHRSLITSRRCCGCLDVFCPPVRRQYHFGVAHVVHRLLWNTVGRFVIDRPGKAYILHLLTASLMDR